MSVILLGQFILGFNYFKRTFWASSHYYKTSEIILWSLSAETPFLHSCCLSGVRWAQHRRRQATHCCLFLGVPVWSFIETTQNSHTHYLASLALAGAIASCWNIIQRIYVFIFWSLQFNCYTGNWHIFLTPRCLFNQIQHISVTRNPLLYLLFPFSHYTISQLSHMVTLESSSICQYFLCGVVFLCLISSGWKVYAMFLFFKILHFVKKLSYFFKEQ